MSESRTTTDLGVLIDSRPMMPVQIWTVFLCALALFLDGYDIQVMALAVPSLAREWGRPPSDFGLALSGVVIGLSLGGAFLAPLGDRFGRKTAVIGAMTLMGAATLLTATALTPGQFVFWRILTGMGLGVCVPNCNAWTSEFSPLRRRALAVVAMNAAVGLGAFSAGLLAPALLHAWGWRGIFMFGGFGPLAVAALMAFTAPESLKFLVSRKPGHRSIAPTLARIAPGVDHTSLFIPEAAGATSGSPLQLLSRIYRSRTVLLWVMMALNLFTLYVLISWLPTLLERAGWTEAHALQGAVLVQLGGVTGGLTLSVFIDRGWARNSLAAAWLLAAVALGLFLVIPSAGLSWGLLILLVGAGVSGAQLSLNALSTTFYPPAIKATGVGWAGVVGGAGSILGPLAGAQLIHQGMASTHVLALLVIPVLACAAGLPLMRRAWQAY